MRKFIVVACFVLSVVGCMDIKPTYPPGNNHFCNKDYDCFEGQHCGFEPGYTVAVCRGNAVSNTAAVPYPAPLGR